MILSMTVSQDDHDSKTPSSDCPGTGLIDLLAAIGRNPSCQPPGVYLRRLALEPLGLSIELTGPARSDARRLIRSNSASTPAPPDTTRATRSWSDPSTLAPGLLAWASAAGSSPSLHRPMTCPW